MIQPAIFCEINIPIKTTCLKNRPPVVMMKRPVVEYAMIVTQYKPLIFHFYVFKANSLPIKTKLSILGSQQAAISVLY